MCVMLPSGMGCGCGWSWFRGRSIAGEGAEGGLSPGGAGDPLLLVETLGASSGLALPSVSGQRGIGLLHMGRLGLITPPDHPHMGKGSRAPPGFT